MDNKEVMATFFKPCFIDLRNANSQKLLDELADPGYYWQTMLKKCFVDLSFIDLGQALIQV